MRKTIPELRRALAQIPEPRKLDDGTCTACLGIGLCKYHQVVGAIRDRERSDTLRVVSDNLREAQRVMGKYNNGCDLNHNED